MKEELDENKVFEPVKKEEDMTPEELKEKKQVEKAYQDFRKLSIPELQKVREIAVEQEKLKLVKLIDSILVPREEKRTQSLIV